MVVLGFLDRISESGLAEGWCWSPVENQVRRNVLLHVDGALFGTIACDQLRDDLAKSLIGDGKHAFSYQLDTSLLESGDHTALIIDELSGTQVGNTIAFTLAKHVHRFRERAADTLPVQSTLVGAIDRLTEDGLIDGWCCDTNFPDHPVLIAVEVAGEIIGTSLAGLYRHDLTHFGSGAGRHGFRFVIPWGTLQGRGVVSVRILDADSSQVIGEPKSIRRRSIDSLAERVADLERAQRSLRTQVEVFATRLQAQPDTGLIFRTIATFFNRFADEIETSGQPLGALQGQQTWNALSSEFEPFAFTIPSHIRTLFVIEAKSSLRGLYDCLKSLHSANVEREAVIVLIDDGSSGDAQLILSVVGGISYHRLSASMSSVSECNRLLRNGNFDHVAFVSPHVRVNPDWFDAVIRTMSLDPPPAAVASRVLGGDGSLLPVALEIDSQGELVELGRGVSRRDPGFLAPRKVYGNGGRVFFVRCFPGMHLDPDISDFAAAIFALSLQVAKEFDGILYDPSSEVRFDEQAEAQYVVSTGIEASERAIMAVRDRWVFQIESSRFAATGTNLTENRLAR